MRRLLSTVASIIVMVMAPAPRALAAGAEPSANAPTDRIPGITRTYQPGITVSVDQIMSLEPTSSPVSWSESPSFGSQVSGSSSEDAGDLPNLPQTVGISFKATDFTEGFALAPQTAGDVGPTQILVHINGRIKLFDKNGNLGALNASAESFWAAVTNLPPMGPQVRYDRLSGRWFVFATTYEDNSNDLLIAVSSGPTITGAASFTFYVMPFAPEGSAFDAWYDLGIGIDANAVYVGANTYCFWSLCSSDAWVIRKSSITDGGPLVATSFPYVDNGGLFAPRGVDNDDPSWTEGYFIGTDDDFFPGALHLVRIYDPGGIPTSSPAISLAVADTTILSQSAWVSTANLEASYRRLHAASMHKNKLTGVTSLWTSQSVETDLTCTAADSGNGRRLAARWYEIGNLTTTPSIVQAGTLCTTAPGNGVTNTERGFLFPTVAATGQGHLALGATFASRTEYAGVAAAGRLRTDPASATRAPESIVLAGLGSYSRLNSQSRNVWGDYSFTDVDPTDDQTVWTFQEYADTNNNWAIRAVQLKAPPPPNIASASNSVCVGATAIPVTIFGTDACAAPTCTNGLCTGGGVCPEFFDPGPDPGGPGFAKHLTAGVNGGVTVNGASIVAPADPGSQRVLSVALSLNTTAATAGTRVVTITNPDGQARSLGVLNVMSNRLPTSSPGGPYTICQGGSVMLVGAASTDPDGLCGDSVVAYAWDLNNDGTFDLTGSTPTVTAAQLTSLGVGVGVNTIKLKVTDSHNGSNTANGTLTILADGAACDDGIACTASDQCAAGVCAGTVITGPPETRNMRVDAAKTGYSWLAQPEATSYDVTRGSLSGLPVGPGVADEVCFGGLAVPVLVEGTLPPQGTGFWYLSRGVSACGAGTYGAQSNGSPRVTTTCP